MKLKLTETYTEKEFKRDAARYVAAVKEGRLLCKIVSISRSGMSRTLEIFELAKCGDMFHPYGFCAFLEALGFTMTPHKDAIRIRGCGFDATYETHAHVVSALVTIGIITEAEAVSLRKIAPHKI